MAVSILLVLVSTVIFSGFEVEILLNALTVQLLLGLFFISLNYPLILKFGFEKSRVWYILITFLIVGAGSALTTVASNTGFQKTTSVSVALFAGIMVLGLLVTSYFISLRIINRKEFIEI